jgi:hypothetical protein
MRLVLALLSAVALAFAVPAAADPPTEIAQLDVFPDVNPCTGLIHTVTITETFFAHFHDGRVHGHSERTITTSPTGFVGHGTDSFVDNGQIIKFTQTDILTNASGDRIRARFVFVLDLSTGTVRVQQFEPPTCLGP